tara:strand:+ start:377 stop:505 length:129 start_codon:yes stop_codon:yes gene_type:complete
MNQPEERDPTLLVIWEWIKLDRRLQVGILIAVGALTYLLMRG